VLLEQLKCALSALFLEVLAGLFKLRELPAVSWCAGPHQLAVDQQAGRTFSARSSYSGSSALIVVLALGLVMNVSVRRFAY
jgi:hypothetical protein